MKILTIATTALLLGATALAFAQTSNQMQNRQNLPPPPAMVDPNRIENVRPGPVIIERETTGMGARQPDEEFIFSPGAFGPGARDPQRNDPTVSPFGPMNNIE